MLNVLSVLYILIFIAAGVLAVRRVLPDAGASVYVPLGCGAGVSLLALLPAAFAAALGFGLTAVISAAAAAVLLIWLWKTGEGLKPVRDVDGAAMWACILPALVLAAVLLHTHVLH